MIKTEGTTREIHKGLRDKTVKQALDPKRENNFKEERQAFPCVQHKNQ